MIDRKRDKELEDLANEYGRAMAEGMEKQAVEVWDSALAAVVLELEKNAKSSEYVLTESVVTLVNGLRKGDDEG
jgi:hypothetical protein